MTTREQTRTDERIEFRSKVPRLGIRWIVQCLGYRCLAIHDKSGKWWDANTDKELTDAIVGKVEQL
jgi:hypothetical protein